MVVDNFEQQWHHHPNPEVDIAVMPLLPIIDGIRSQGKEPFYKAIPHTLIPSPEQLQELDAIEEVVFFGYPNGMYDSHNLTPVARRGYTATPLQLDYDGNPTFLIDASVFPGSSGSPVLIYNPGPYSANGTLVLGGTRVLFLGVLAEVMIQDDEGTIDFISVPTRQMPIIRTRQMIDLGLVYKSTLVTEAVLDFLKLRNLIPKTV